MQKPYSLDFSIERDIDRLEAVRQILDTVNRPFTNKELEQFASYILYGKDENGKNAIQRKDCTDSDTKRYKTFQKIEDKTESLDKILENPLTNEQDLIALDEKPLYLKKRRTVKRPQDADVPGMVELWDAIDHIEHTIAANEGELPFNDDDTVLRDPYRLWQLKHQLIDMRRHQYYLLESYKPTLHFNAVINGKTPPIDFDSDSYYWITYREWKHKIEANYFPFISNNLADYEVRWNPTLKREEIKWVVRHQNFNWENPWHVRHLISHYSDIYMEDYDKLNSWGRTLCYDLERYVEQTDLSPARYYIFIRKIDRASFAEIREELQQMYGLKYTEVQLSNIAYKEIPRKIAETATRARLLKETPESERKVCSRCKRSLPMTPLFYARNAGKRLGVESSCKECQRKMRIERGKQTNADRRRKDKTMYEVQTGKDNR